MTTPAVVSPTAATASGPTPRRRPVRPRSEYWDVFTAGWRQAPPTIPTPRPGD
jgi:hypothetical protein